MERNREDFLCIKPVTHATETGTRNWYQKFAHVSVNLVPDFSGTRFWYRIEHSSIPSQKLSATGHKPCNVIGRSVVIVFVVISYRLFFVKFCDLFI